jgi:hypothetical protein
LPSFELTNAQAQGSHDGEITRCIQVQGA